MHSTNTRKGSISLAIDPNSDWSVIYSAYGRITYIRIRGEGYSRGFDITHAYVKNIDMNGYHMKRTVV